MIEWAVASSALILTVVALRRCLMGKISLRLQYGLWALVLLRLLVPVSLGESAWSVANALPLETREEALRPWYAEDLGTTLPAEPGGEKEQMPAAVSARPEPGGSAGGRAEQLPSHATAISLGRGLAMVWGIGALILGLWLLGINVRFAQSLRSSQRPLAVEECPLPVYVTGATSTPCLFGLLRPRIYVTEEVAADEATLRHSLAHELTHYRHRDHLWAAARGLCLALHWYNPLVWLAAVLSRRDGELCCDEATVRRLGEGERASYGRTLLAVTCKGKTNPLLTATSMTGSGKSIQERIRLLVKRPRTAVCTLAAVVVIAAVAAGCTFTGAQKGDGEVQIALTEGIDTPQAVSDYAREYVGGELTYYTEELGYEITGAEIVGLTPIDTGTAGENGGVSMYLLEYRLHAAHPDRIVLAGGMSMEEGAITEWSSAGQPYLLLRWEDVEDETRWEPVRVTHTDNITQDYGTPEMLEKYGDAYTAAAMEVYLPFFGSSSEDEDPARGPMDAEVSLRRDGYDIPIGPGNWVDLFPPTSDGEPDIQIMENYEPIYGEGDYWDRWSVEGFSALRYYAAAEDAWSANTIDVTRTDLYTPRGIQVGNSRAQVLEAYPEALTGDYWGEYPEEPDLLAYVARNPHAPGEINDLSQLEFSEGLGPAILFFFEGDTLRQITLTNMFN